jgi:hypothetical protein
VLVHQPRASLYVEVLITMGVQLVDARAGLDRARALGDAITLMVRCTHFEALEA